MFKVLYRKLDSGGRIIESSDDSIFFPNKKDAQKFINRLKHQAKKDDCIISADIFEFENN